MPRYSDDIIEEVRSRNDIVDVIQNYVQLKKKGGSYFGLCPFHNEKSPSFSVSRDKQMYYCFGCGAGGNVYSFLMNYENLTFPEAVKELADRVGMSLPQEEMTREDVERDKRKAALFAIQKDAAMYYYGLLRSGTGERGMEYFRSRELTDDTMKKFGLGYSDVRGGVYGYLKNKGYSNDLIRASGLVTYVEGKGFRDKFWNRVMFPIMDTSSRVVGFGGRVMGEGEPKYLNSPETEIFDKGRILYGAHLARKSRRDMMILCEGYMDVISLHQAGFDNAVASLGTALTEKNAMALKRFRKDVYLSYDSDGAGVKAALRAIAIFKKIGVTCKVINMRPHKDPDEFIKSLGTEEYEKRIQQAENSFLDTIRMAEPDYDLRDPESKTAFQRYMADKVLEFEEEIERNNYIGVLCEKYNMGVDDFRKLVAHEAARGIANGKNPGNDMVSIPDVDYDQNPDMPRKPVSAAKKKTMTRDTGLQQSERLLLTWMTYDSNVYEILKEYLTENDFTEGVHRDVACQMVKDISDGKPPDPAAIMDRYSDESDRQEIARIYHSEEELKAEAEKSKAIKEALIRVKKSSIERENLSMDSSGADSFKKRLDDRKFLEKLEKTDFKFGV
jgi:DNA primase